MSHPGPTTIAVVGGGPGGLYFSLLAKKLRPEADVTVYERRPEGATFGWGVVFSERALHSLKAADEPSYAGIDRALTRWDSMHFVHQGARVPVRGYRFSAIERIHLLRVLQERCREVGVRLRFGVEVTDLAELGSPDLIVAADGVGSPIRSQLRNELGTRVRLRSQRYLWCGTSRAFDNLSLIFRETQCGPFVAHAYPYSASAGTFIVECPARTWRAAGLDREVDDAALAQLCEIFADDLQGSALRSKQERWTSFAVVANRRWHHRNVVLVGDALHTAHFSIGSGTKMAIDDAISLAQALHDCGDTAQAFRRYRSERSGAILALQEAAWSSMRWFETIENALELSPIELAFQGVTRSARVDRAHLLARDREFVERYDRSLSLA